MLSKDLQRRFESGFLASVFTLSFNSWMKGLKELDLAFGWCCEACWGFTAWYIQEPEGTHLLTAQAPAMGPLPLRRALG